MKTKISILTIALLTLLTLSFSQTHAPCFDGNDDFISLGDSVGDGIRTIEFWFQPVSDIDSSSLTNQTALVIRNHNGSELGEFGLYLGASTIPDRAGRVVFFRRIGTAHHYIVSDRSEWKAGEWHHAAGTIDPSTGMKLYIDGVLQADTNSTTAHTDTVADDVTIAAWGTIPGRNFQGNISDLRFWNSERSASEINTYMTQPVIPPYSSDLAAYWKLDEGSGTDIYDATGNGYDGTFNGYEWKQLNNGIHFDGDDNCWIGSMSGQQFRTIEMKFKLDNDVDSSNPETIALISRDNPGASTIDEFALYIGQSSWSGREGRLVFYNNTVGSSSTYIVSDANSWEANRWYHVSAVIDTINGMQMFIDGVRQADMGVSTSPTNNASHGVVLGTWGSLEIRHLEGTLDEVRLWSVARDSAEILSSMCDTLTGSESGLVTYYRAESDSSGYVLDHAGSYNGMLNGSTLLTARNCLDGACVSTLTSSEIIVERTDKVTLYPNPANSVLNISGVNGSETIQLLDMTGKVLRDVPAKQNTQFDVSRLPNGIYLIRVVSTNGQPTLKKFVKTN